MDIDTLYETYTDDLRRAKKEQRELRDGDPKMWAQLDDLEAEITYLLLRTHRPETVVEVGCLHGWSTSWILRALRDNGHGHLHSYDLIAHATRHVPLDLSTGRWTFVRGNVRNRLSQVPAAIDYLFIDAAHSARLAKWYLTHVIPGLQPGTPVSVHDVFHRATPRPFTEGAVLLDWLRRGRRSYVTVAPAREPDVHRRLLRLREELGLADQVHTGTDNPMLFFTV
jgi:predicted O-methyltransferase YrrM